MPGRHRGTGEGVLARGGLRASFFPPTCYKLFRPGIGVLILCQVFSLEQLVSPWSYIIYSVGQFSRQWDGCGDVSSETERLFKKMNLELFLGVRHCSNQTSFSILTALIKSHVCLCNVHVCSCTHLFMYVFVGVCTCSYLFTYL